MEHTCSSNVVWGGVGGGGDGELEVDGTLEYSCHQAAERPGYPLSLPLGTNQEHIAGTHPYLPRVQTFTAGVQHPQLVLYLDALRVCLEDQGSHRVCTLSPMVPSWVALAFSPKDIGPALP